MVVTQDGQKGERGKLDGAKLAAPHTPQVVDRLDSLPIGYSNVSMRVARKGNRPNRGRWKGGRKAMRGGTDRPPSPARASASSASFSWVAWRGGQVRREPASQTGDSVNRWSVPGRRRAGDHDSSLYVHDSSMYRETSRRLS